MKLHQQNLLFITLDTLRLDVAQQALAEGDTPFLAQFLPNGWEPRHTPGSFTYAAHHAFFAGFLPTPIAPGKHPRRFAARFPGSETTVGDTIVFDAPDLVTGLRSADYHTICIGGVGFFNKRSPIGSVLPNLFDESVWSAELGVTSAESTRHQVAQAISRLNRQPSEQRIFLFINISALHQPNCIFVDGATTDSPATQQAALAYVDSQLPPLFANLQQRGETFVILCADHGTAYGEDGYVGHRIGHEVVYTVPYAEFVLSQKGTQSGTE